MSTSESFKYDVRIRERMLAKGLLTETDLTSHLEGLKDLEGESRLVSVAQPAFGGSSEEEEEDAPESTERP